MFYDSEQYNLSTGVSQINNGSDTPQLQLCRKISLYLALYLLRLRWKIRLKQIFYLVINLFRHFRIPTV